MNCAIQTTRLSKSYGRVCAVDSIDLQVKPGEIYGFLGLNGAGKTTTIRALLGMIRPSSGKVEVLGQSVGPRGRGPWQQVGYLVEKPSAYPELSVKENLEIARRMHGIKDREATDRIITQLGLSVYADRKAGVLSTGNLQRLGLARALLHGPELLILDEPANGLDPAGVVEIRDLISSLASEKGVTVFMSSHILTEVDRLATRIGIIHKGRLLDELDAQRLAEARMPHLVVQTRDSERAQIVLKQAGFTLDANPPEGTISLREERAVSSPDEVASILVNSGVPPVKLVVEHENLEDYFLRLTRENT